MNRFPETHFNSIGPWLKNCFGGRVIKLSLDGGFTCPNRDGKCGYGGCSFCPDNGSGTFASSIGFRCTDTDSGSESGSLQQAAIAPASIAAAMEAQILAQRHKWPDAKYIAYFQSHTNTYAPAEKLRRLWDAALSYDGVAGLAIATRPDCLPEDILELLDEYNKKTFLWVELGLQTSNERTAASFNRCYNNKVFEEAMENLSRLGIRTVVHLILGLPGETEEDYMRSAGYVAGFNPFGIKLHMLHLMKGTRMAEELTAEACSYRENIQQSVIESQKETESDCLLPQNEPGNEDFLKEYLNNKLISMEEYVNCVCNILERLPDTITIHRLTGDAPGDTLLAPEWTRNKHAVLNAIQHEFAVRGTYQGSSADGSHIEIE